MLGRSKTALFHFRTLELGQAPHGHAYLGFIHAESFTPINLFNIFQGDFEKPKEPLSVD